MKKLILVTAVGLCTLPAMAAPLGNHMLARSSTASTTPATSAAELPLPPAQLEYSLAVPGFGKNSHDPSIKPVNLPGLGTIDFNVNNPGKGNGTAKYSEQINIDPNSSKTPRRLSADYSVPEGSHQLIAKYSYSGSGFGKGSDPAIKPVTLPGLGTIDRSFDNGGKGNGLTYNVVYTSPKPKSN